MEVLMNVPFRLGAVALAVLAAAGCAWTAARPLSIELSGGENLGGTGSTTATLKAVYTADSIYFHFGAKYLAFVR
jgi:hypothetical protein